MPSRRTSHHRGIHGLDMNNHNSFITTLLKLFILYQLADLISYSENLHISQVTATSINYGISQQPITDISQLMPKLCQNQSVICEGSFCIPGVRKCVCDLRMPVQFGRFCLRQLDIETKCFVTNQCNHTIKDAVCIDINSNAILDAESSKFKLDQWQQLNELRQQSQSVLTKDVPKQQVHTITTITTESPHKPMFLFDSNTDSFNFDIREDVIISNARNSPYEINYSTPELLLQNHTRRRTNFSDRSILNSFTTPTSDLNANKVSQLYDKIQSSSNSVLDVNSNIITQNATESSKTTTTATTTTTTTTMSSSRTTTRSIGQEQTEVKTSDQNDYGISHTTIQPEDQNKDLKVATTTVVSIDLTVRKKMITKSTNWPPGVCSCPFGYMFDSMLRKCLALSLSESHCQTDSDCRQIIQTHCSVESRKCECDEPMVWNQKELACVRPRPLSTTESPNQRKESSGFVENLLPALTLAKLLPDYTIMLLIFVVIVIIGTLIILKLTVKCFSSNNSALISPKTKKKKSNNLPPRSPYATLRRPDHKPSSHLSNFTQTTRGRILNYDFEQEALTVDTESQPRSPQPSASNNQRLNKEGLQSSERTATIRTNTRNQKFSTLVGSNSQKNSNGIADENDEQTIELNDNISISQLESESKSDNSLLTIPPGPPPTQQPPYMLKSAMKVQGSAIAAAAAAVANKRMQMAQKKNQEQQASGKVANGSPVFL